MSKRKTKRHKGAENIKGKPTSDVNPTSPAPTERSDATGKPLANPDKGGRGEGVVGARESGVTPPLTPTVPGKLTPTDSPTPQESTPQKPNQSPQDKDPTPQSELESPSIDSKAIKEKEAVKGGSDGDSSVTSRNSSKTSDESVFWEIHEEVMKDLPQGMRSKKVHWGYLRAIQGLKQDRKELMRRYVNGAAPFNWGVVQVNEENG